MPSSRRQRRQPRSRRVGEIGQKPAWHRALPGPKPAARKSCGFSLLELLIYIAISTLIVTAVLATFFSINRGRGQIEARNEVTSNLRFAIEKISQDLKAASAVGTPAAAGNSTSSLSMTVDGTAVNYCVASNVLRRQTGGACDGSSPAISSGEVIAENINFSRIENTNAVLSQTVINIEISLTMHFNSSNPDWQYTGSKKTTISLR